MVKNERSHGVSATFNTKGILLTFMISIDFRTHFLMKCVVSLLSQHRDDKIKRPLVITNVQYIKEN